MSKVMSYTRIDRVMHIVGARGYLKGASDVSLLRLHDTLLSLRTAVKQSL